MFGEVDEHTTQETYLGHNMADAIACWSQRPMANGFGIA